MRETQAYDSEVPVRRRGAPDEHRSEQSEERNVDASQSCRDPVSETEKPVTFCLTSGDDILILFRE